MHHMLLHGLGQDHTSWDNVIPFLQPQSMDCPDLYKLVSDTLDYMNLVDALYDYCHLSNDKVNICGLSLGGILALEFAAKHPEKVDSLILIGVPHHIPKLLFLLQSFVFKFMPQSAFTKMGISKKDVISLVISMKHICIPDMLGKVKCPVFILCGEKDKVNMKSAYQLQAELVNSNVQIIPGAGHEVNVDKPEELATNIKTFWR